MFSYIDLNDYEIIYYIRMGNTKALELLIKKYDSIIYYEINKIYRVSCSDKKNDLLQEGRIVLLRCLKVYNENVNECSFYNYFYVSLKHRFARILKTDTYYDRFILLEDCESYIKNQGSENAGVEFIFDSYLEKLIYDEIFKQGFTISSFCEKYNLSYYRMKKEYDNVSKKLVEFYNL